MPKGHWYAPSSWYCTLPREERKGLLLFLFVKLSPGAQFATTRTWSPTCYINLYRAQSKFKIVVLRTLLSENTFAGHWETVLDCMENIGKCEQWLILPRNCLRTQLWFHKNIQSSIQKVPMSSTIQRQLLISGVQHGSKCVLTSRSGSRCHLLLSVLMSLCPSPAPQLLLSGFWSPGCMPMPTIIFTASVHAGALLGTNSRPARQSCKRSLLTLWIVVFQLKPAETLTIQV